MSHKPETVKKFEAIKLIEGVQEAGSQRAFAKKVGVAECVISKKMKHPVVQKTLDEINTIMLRRAGGTKTKIFRWKDKTIRR